MSYYYSIVLIHTIQMYRLKLNNLFFFFFIIVSSSQAQLKSIRLDSCLSMARNNYPLINQLGMLTAINQHSIRNINSSWLPGVTSSAQASYQSDVTSINISIPGFPAIDPPNKDQYKFYLDIVQNVYDGGVIGDQRKLTRLQSELEHQNVEAELQKIKEKVIETYFAALLVKEQLKIIGLSKTELNTLLDKTKVAYDVKAASGYQLNMVLVEREKLEQKETEVQSQLISLLRVLSLLTGQSITAETEIINPELKAISNSNNRPEFKMLQLQESVLDISNRLNQSKSLPKLALFGQTGYANPALNFLKNKFDYYYLAGIRLNWNINSFYNHNREKKINILQKSINQLKQESFEFNLQLQRVRLEEEAIKFETLTNSDSKILELKIKIKEASKLQYEGGIISLNDYLKDLNGEELARTNSLIHRLSFLQSIYLNNNLYGN